MGRLNKGSKPTRAERKAEKKAAKVAAKDAEFDARELAKEEKRAEKAARSRRGRKRKNAAAEMDDLQPDPRGFEDDEPSAGFGAFTLSEPARDNEHNQTSDYQPAMRAPREARPLGGSQPLPDDLNPLPMDRQPLALHQIAQGPDTMAPQAEAIPEPEPRRRSLGMRIFGKKTASESVPESRPDPALTPMGKQGTQIRPAQASNPASGRGQMNADPVPLAPAAGPQLSPADNFATLRRAAGGGQATRIDLDNVLVLDDPVVEPGGAAMAAVSRAEHQPSAAHDTGFSENWLGLWVSEDGEAIFIEEDGDGWFAVTVLPDPTTTCHSGPDYPEIQSSRMPASWSKEAVGEFDGERLSVITVPGLPDTHRSPMMYIYFLTSIPAVEGSGNRFATPDDPTRRVFIAADFEPGTVNPWSDRDDIEWIDPSVNFYKAPGKLDAYMMRRMAKDDPLN